MNTIIYVLGYNRPNHLRATLTELTNELNSYSGLRNFDVQIEIDIEKKGKLNQDIIQVLQSFTYSYNIANSNRGLRMSIFNILKSFKSSNYDSMILLEDDILIKENCLVYFDKMLTKYEDDKSVIQISAFSPYNFEKSFIVSHPRISTWGWATWKYKFPELTDFKYEWNNYNNRGLTNSQLKKVYEYMPDVIKLFDFMRSGKINAWSLDLLRYSVINNKTTIYPSSSLINNIGMDGTGENCGNSKSFTLFKKKKHLLKLNNLNEVGLSNNLRKLFNQYYSPSLIWRIYRKIYGA